MLAPIPSAPDLADQVYESLLEGICSGEMAPGERFTQEALASRLGVSRQPVLQALGMLRPRLRRGRAIANNNTLMYVLINLRALARIRTTAVEVRSSSS